MESGEAHPDLVSSSIKGEGVKAEVGRSEGEEKGNSSWICPGPGSRITEKVREEENEEVLPSSRDCGMRSFIDIDDDDNNNDDESG